jgi:8-oxo-dGTP pyrophosphatase MutT (NUDIX family)
MRIIAREGPSRFLVAVSKDEGRVIDMDQGVVFAPFNLGSILMRGVWEPFTGSEQLLQRLLSRVRPEAEERPAAVAAPARGAREGFLRQLRRTGRRLAEVTSPWRPAVYGVCLNDKGEVLLAVNNGRPNFVNFPGGGILSGEAPIDALKREFREETGMEVEPISLLWATRGRHVNYFRPSQQLIGMYYLVESTGGTLSRRGNGKDVKRLIWAPLQQLPVESMSEFDREAAVVLQRVYGLLFEAQEGDDDEGE